MTAFAATNYAQRGVLTGIPSVVRRLSDLRGCFADTIAYDNALATGNPNAYSLSNVHSVEGEGQLHYGLCQLMPGRIGSEYFLTRGHLHVWRSAAEVYVGLSGEGYVLLERESTGESRMLPFTANTTVYVPGYTAHRTVNTGSVPLTYVGIYPAQAGHDYAAIAEKNFRSVIVAIDGKPTLVERQIFLSEHLSQSA